MSTDLSKLLVLEAALEHLLKVNPQEELEYIDDTKDLPKDTPLVRTERGAIGYYPSQIGKKSEVEEQGVSRDRPELEPDEEREISAVTAPDSSESTSFEPDINEKGIEVRFKQKADGSGFTQRIGTANPEDAIDEFVRRHGLEDDFENSPDKFSIKATDGEYWTYDDIPKEEGVDRTDQSPSADELDLFPEHLAMVTADQANDYFEQVSLYLDFHLQQTKGSDFKPFLGKDIDPARLEVVNATKAGYTDGSKEGAGEPTGLGINAMSNWTMTIDGKPFIYKLVKGENQAEILSYSIDRALGLNIVPYNKQHAIDVDVLNHVIERTHKVDQGIEDFFMEEHAREGRGVKAGGHFQEFCTNCLGREDSIRAMGKMMASEEGREEFFKVILLDFLVGNDDRHTGNYLITDEHKIVAIDNGFAGHEMSFYDHQEKKSADLLGQNFMGIDINKNLDNMGFPFGMAGELRDEVGGERVREISDKKALEREAEAVFDKYFTPANKKILNKALRMSMWELKVGKGRKSDFAKLKDKFVSHAAHNIQGGIIGHGTGIQSITEKREEWKKAREAVLEYVDELDDDLVGDSEIAAAIQNAAEEAGLEDVSLSNE